MATEIERITILTYDVDLIEHKCEYEIHNQYDRYNKLDKYELRLFMKGDSHEEWFDFKLSPISETVLKVTDMFIGKSAHRKKGIPEVLIVESKKIFNKKVVSSSNKHPILISERRSDEASKVWKRLEKKGLVRYNEISDVFEVL